MKTSPQIVNLGEMHFTQADLYEFEDPRAADCPDGWTIDVRQCVDCGAHTNDGNPENIVHYASCTPGEAEKWTKFYNQI